MEQSFFTDTLIQLSLTQGAPKVFPLKLRRSGKTCTGRSTLLRELAIVSRKGAAEYVQGK